MRNEIWASVPEIGELIIEEYLVVGNEPILFSCRCENLNLRYLVMMYDSDNFEYVIAPIYPNDLACMLNNEITMEEAFRKYGLIYFTHGDYENIRIEEFNSKDFPEEFLPKKDDFFELKLNYIDRYIQLLQNESCDVIDYSFDRTLLTKCLEYYAFLENRINNSYFNYEELFGENILFNSFNSNNSYKENKAYENMNSSAA